MHTPIVPRILTACLLALGCGSYPVPKQALAEAQATFAGASQGPAATLDLARLHSASESVDLAEQSFKTAKLGTTSGQLGHAKLELALRGQALQNQTEHLGVEQGLREEADKHAARAAAELAPFASVEQEHRGMVITLSGSVLFASSDGSDLVPGAQMKLNEVADAVSKQDTESTIVVEGHTDSQGGASYNQDLSRRRAHAVRDYLAARGIPADRLTSHGFGPTRPIADNASAEGRASNQRVEIVVQAGWQRP
jgi:outer membrane protein OmpA-like peptidoglycan-associated protein